uniref:Putative ovule protein n=1 Tax=Solanum chacoense TaxID=4108 RepID=A0A0V0GR20_SOLCH
MGDNTGVLPNVLVVATLQLASTELLNATHPYFISPTDSPRMLLVNTAFDGKGIAGWKRGMLIGLSAKNKAGFINSSSPQPAADSDIHKAWLRANNMVISWLLNSLPREISESVIYSSTAKELWSDLEARFGQSSGAKLFQGHSKVL